MTVTNDDVSIFADYCVYVRSVYMHGKTLFEIDQADKDMLAETAPVFFGDLNKVLIEYAILQVCKITDPAKDFRGNENHTTSFFVTAADFSLEPDKGRRLAELHASMDRLREKLKPARDKVISHLDRNAALSKPIIGAASEDEWSQFWRDLDEFVAILYQKYVSDPPVQILSVGNITDTWSLKSAIRKGTLFDSLAVDGPNKTISNMCVDMLLAAQNR
jgi:hypothetical protein